MENICKSVMIISDGKSSAAQRAAELLTRQGIKVYTEGENIPEKASVLLICDRGLASPAFEKIETLRGFSDIPLLTVSEACGEIYTTVALAKGADMCMSAENLSGRELSARVNALARRYFEAFPQETPQGGLLINGGISLDRRSREVFSEGSPVKMTATQFGIVEYLMENCGKVCSVEEIYSSVWRETPYCVHRTVVDHIRRIRGKIEPDPHHPSYIKAVFGAGYKMVKKECG